MRLKLNTSFALVQWVLVSYFLVITALVLAAARLGDMLGKKSVYLGGLILFTIGALLCGLAPSVQWLIACRVLQACGGVFISALSFAITTEVSPASERGKALGIVGGVLSMGLALGPSIAGFLIEAAGWRTLFGVHLPLGILAVLIIDTWMPPSPHTERSQPFDWVGVILIAAILVAFSLGMTEIQLLGADNPIPWLLLLAAAIRTDWPAAHYRAHADGDHVRLLWYPVGSIGSPDHEPEWVRADGPGMSAD